jgi:hypothetical protein
LNPIKPIPNSCLYPAKKYPLSQTRNDVIQFDIKLPERHIIIEFHAIVSVIFVEY